MSHNSDEYQSNESDIDDQSDKENELSDHEPKKKRSKKSDSKPPSKSKSKAKNDDTQKSPKSKKSSSSNANGGSSSSSGMLSGGGNINNELAELITEKNAHTLLAEYFTITLRPYHVTGLHENIRKALSRSQLERALERCVEEGTIQKKELGKSAIYWATQPELSENDAEEQAALDEEANSLAEELSTVKNEISALQSKLKALGNEMSEAQLDTAIKHYERRISETGQSLSKFKNTKTKTFTAEQCDTIQQEFNSYCDCWKKNKKRVRDIVDLMKGDSSAKDKAIEDKLRIDRDEDNEADIQKVAQYFKPLPPASKTSKNAKLGGKL